MPLPSQVYCPASGSGPALPCIDLAAAAKMRGDMICTVKSRADTLVSETSPTPTDIEAATAVRGASDSATPSLARPVSVSVNKTPHRCHASDLCARRRGQLVTLYLAFPCRSCESSVPAERLRRHLLSGSGPGPTQQCVLLAAREQRSMQAAARLHCVGANKKVQTLVGRKFRALRPESPTSSAGAELKRVRSEAKAQSSTCYILQTNSGESFRKDFVCVCDFGFGV